MSKGKTTTTQQANVPGYLQDIYKDMSTRGLAAADLPFTPYTGEMVAGFSPDQLQAMQATRGLFGETMGLDPRQELARLAAAPSPTISPVSGAAASILDTDISKYEDPYIQGVIDPALADIQRRQDLEQQRAQDRAIRSGAFGGSRSALIESEATRPFAEEAAQTIAGLRSAGFGQAATMAEADARRRQEMAKFAPELELRARQQQAGLLGGQLGEQYKALGLLGGIGGQQQALEQARLQAQRGEFERELGYPAYQLGLLGQAAGGISPAVIGQTQTAKKSVGFGDILGAGAGLLGAGFMGGAFNKDGAFSKDGAFGGIFSDQRLKTNIKKLGKQNGYNVYSWDWNETAKELNIDKKYPYNVGVMAQEVKHIPGAVTEDANGYYLVNYGVL
ncbi:MAG: hypothetical protein CMQ53_01060 [Gammaproteobacteria bacterium]|nr:hypothetical protein [Gammaproteobacteria bacterium]